jgi:hypothetical protein
MSNVLYPISAIKAVKSPAYNRVAVDAFEDGGSGSRAFWGAQNFKRRFTVTHAALTLEEYRYLRSFYTQRDGAYDPFWFRDNVNRRGNAKVRFVSPLPEGREGMIFPELQVEMEEIAPIRVMPEIDEIETAAGSALSVYYDANREVYFDHTQNLSTAPNGIYTPANYTDGSGAYDAAYQVCPCPWQAGGAANIAGVSSSQWQNYHFDGTGWARSTANVPGFSTTQPACSIFAMLQHSTTATKQVIFAFGAMGGALGLALNAANKFEPYLGGADTFVNAKQTNPLAWCSVGITWALASNDVKFYLNGALIGTDTVVRSFSTGKVALGAAPDGTLKSNPGNAMVNADAAHLMAFNAELTLAQIKAVHNLLAYQYGIALV